MGVCGCIIPSPNCHCHSWVGIANLSPQHDVYADAREEYRKVIKEQRDEIERLREALQKIVDKNPFHNQCPPAFDLQYYATTVAEMVAIASAALKGDE